MSEAPPPPPPPTYILREHRGPVNFIHLFNDDQCLASCDGEGWVVIWRMRTRRPIVKWKAHKESCLKVTTVNNDTLISQGRDNMIHIWKLSSLNEIEASTPECISSIVYNALGFCKLSCDENNASSTLLCFPSMDDIALFDVYDLTYQCYVLRNIGQTDSGTHRLGSCMAVELFRASDSLFVAAGYESGKVALWEIKEEKVARIVWQQQGHTEPVLDLSIDPMNSCLISSSADNQIIKYSLATGDIIKKITIKKSGLVALRIRPDNKLFATGGYDGRIRIFSMKSMKPLAILQYHRDSVYSLDFGKNDNLLVASSLDNRISLWNIY